MEYEIIITPKAKELLGEIIRFIASVNKTSAIKIKDSILSSILSLQTMPERHPFIDEQYIPKNTFRKMIISHRYMIIYEIVGNTVYVEYVIDCRKNYQWLLEAKSSLPDRVCEPLTVLGL